LSALERFDDLGLPIAVAASMTHCHVATVDADTIVLRGYDRPSWTLRHQGSVATPDPRTRWAVSSDGHFFGWSLPEGEDGKPDGPPTLLLPWRQPSSVAVGTEGELPVAIAAAEAGVAVAMRSARGVRVVAFAKDLVMRVEIVLAGATTANLRVHDRAVVATDDQGRVVAVDLEDGALIRDLRI
jgi:hypothetical protein